MISVVKKARSVFIRVCRLVFGLRDGYPSMIGSFSKKFHHIKVLHRGLLTGYDNDRQSTACFEKGLSSV